jgi:hypothetical protein
MPRYPSTTIGGVGAGGGAVWGRIQGELAQQQDIAAALAAKADAGAEATAQWGQVTGDITQQADLATAIHDAVADATGTSFVLVPIIVTTAEDTPLTASAFSGANAAAAGSTVLLYTVEGNDGIFLPGATVTAGGMGDVTLEADGTIEFKPAVNWHGSFPLVSYAARSDIDIRWCSFAIHVTSVNDAPAVRGDYAVCAVNQSATIFPLVNDADADGDTVTITQINGAAPVVGVPQAVEGGVFVWNANKSVRITPDTGFVGQIVIPYSATDGIEVRSANITLDVGIAEVHMFSPISPADPSLIPWFNTVANFYGPAFSEHNPTPIENGPTATPLTYTEDYGQFIGGDTATGRQAWLYDNCTTLYLIYKRTGDPLYWDECLRRTELYYSRVTVDPSDGIGYLAVNSGDKLDVRYGYAVPALWYEHETGDQRYREKAIALAKQKLTQPKVYTLDLNFWTERHRGYCIRELLATYILTADPVWLNHCTDFVVDTFAMCAASGAPLHTEYQHEGGNGVLMASTWMANLLVSPMLQWYRVTGDSRFLPWLSRYGDWMLDGGLYVPGEGIPGRIPWYYKFASGVGFTDSGAEDDMCHSYDMRGFFKAVRWAKALLGQDTTACDQAIADLTLSANYHFTYFTRATSYLARYRIAPSRKGNWMFGDMSMDYTDAFALTVPLPAPIPAPVNTAAPTISGTFNQGEVVTLSPGTWTPSSGANAPTFTYQWQRSADDGATWTNISGATATTYTLTGTDVGKRVRVKVTGTNARATASAYSAGTAVNAAGAPSLTLDLPPTLSVSALSSMTLTVAATGSGLTFTFQKSTNSGATWADVQASAATSYVVASVPSTDHGAQYRVVVSNTSGSVTSTVLALTVTAAVRRVGVTAGGTDNGSGAAAYYASLNAALAGEVQDLVAAELILAIELDAFTDTTAVMTAGLAYTVNADNYIWIKPRSGQGHGGVLNAGYKLVTAALYDRAMYLSIPYTQMEGFTIQSTNTGAGSAKCVAIAGGTDSVTAHSMFLIGTSESEYGFECNGANFTADNCVIIGTKVGVVNNNYGAGPMRLTNITAVGQSSKSFLGPGGTETIVKNCYGKAITTAFDLVTSGANQKVNCASADSSGSSGLTGVPYSTITFTSVTPGSENLALAGTSALIGAGVNSSVTTNIAGATRSSPPNIGAY